MDIETLAQILHEAGRAAVEKNLLVRRDVPSKGFIEWPDLDEPARQGRRVQAAYLLDRFAIKELSGKAGPVPLPRWKCHKEVEAAKILRIDPGFSQDLERNEYGLVLINPEMISGKGWLAKVSEEFIKKHNPQPGGYYVRYEDGYESYSPAEAFEKGYTRALEDSDFSPEQQEAALKFMQKFFEIKQQKLEAEMSGIQEYAKGAKPSFGGVTPENIWFEKRITELATAIYKRCVSGYILGDNIKTIEGWATELIARMKDREVRP